MQYEKIYNALINKAKNRVIKSYTEKHHIVPRCIGGSDDLTNLVALTPEEHYVAHQLLCKMYPNNHSLAKAAMMMTAQRPNNKVYGWLRKRHARAQSICQAGQGNSQHGTQWIYNIELCESKKISATEQIPAGWKKGRVVDFNAVAEKNEEQKQKQLLKSLKQQKEVDKYREYYKKYKEVGWNEFVKLTKYDKSQPNLVTRFNRLLPEFVPQNGKKRAKS
jgi:hypothetical protein